MAVQTRIDILGPITQTAVTYFELESPQLAQQRQCFSVLYGVDDLRGLENGPPAEGKTSV